jgi:hypothetical protein
MILIGRLHRSSAVLLIVAVLFSCNLALSLVKSCCNSNGKDIVDSGMVDRFCALTSEAQRSVAKQFLLAAELDFERAVNYYMDSKVFTRML